MIFPFVLRGRPVTWRLCEPLATVCDPLFPMLRHRKSGSQWGTAGWRVSDEVTDSENWQLGDHSPWTMIAPCSLQDEVELR